MLKIIFKVQIIRHFVEIRKRIILPAVTKLIKGEAKF